MSTLLEQASLVLIPSGYKEDVVYSQIPTNGNGDLSFTRASNGTRVNSAGLVEVCPWNLLEYSEDFDNAYWPKSDTTITANATTAPNGTTTADKFIASATNANHLINKAGAIPVISGQTYTFGMYAKASEYSFIRIQLQASLFPESWVNFNLSNGTVGLTSGGVTYSIESVGSGWYRCSITQTATGTGNSGVQPFVLDSDRGTSSPSYTGNGSSGIFIWGAQLNIGSTAKPYFPTTDRLNVPRLTYQNGGGGCPSLLLEKQSTNLLTYSEQFDNAAWTKDGVTISANATTSPDGTQNADKIIGAASSGNKIIFQVNSITLGQPFTASAFFKKGEYKNAFLRVGGQTANPYVIYDLDTQSVVSTSGASSTQIESMGNGWYRISLTSLSATTTVIAPNVAFAPNSGYTISATNVLQYTGDGTSGGFAWGAQIEISSYKTSYISTQAASATRVADACIKTGISSLIGQTSGTVFLIIPKFIAQPSGSGGAILSLHDGSSNNRMGIIVSGSQIIIYIITSNVEQMAYTFTPSSDVQKIAFSYTNNDVAIALNGSIVHTDTSATIPATSAIALNTYGFVDIPAGSSINEVALFKTRLTNSEIQSLTA